jgi:hypothetical protein
MVQGANPYASSGGPHCTFYGNGFTGGNMPCEYANMKGDCPKFTTEPISRKQPKDIGEMMKEPINGRFF